MDIATILNALKGIGKSSAKRQDELIDQISQIEEDKPETTKKKLKSLLFAHRLEVYVRITALISGIALLVLAFLILLNPRDYFTTDIDKLFQKVTQNPNSHNIKFNISPHHQDTTHFDVVYSDSLELGTLQNLRSNNILSLRPFPSSDDYFRWEAISDNLQLGIIRFQQEEFRVEPRSNIQGPYAQNEAYEFTRHSNQGLYFQYSYTPFTSNDSLIDK